MAGNLGQVAGGFGLVCYAVVACAALASPRWKRWARGHRWLDFCAALLLLTGFVRMCECAYPHRDAAGYVGLGAGLVVAAAVLFAVRGRRAGTRSGRAG